MIGGYFVCSYARSSAPGDYAIDGNTQVNEDGNVVTEALLTGQTFTLVNINVSDCKIVIHGDAETSSVRLVNFSENSYIASSSEKTLTVSTNISLFDYISFDGSGVAFGGVWKTLRSFFTYDIKGDREIHVYIGKDAEISRINISTGENTTLSLSNLNKDCDITVNANNSLVDISGINAAALTVSGSASDITLGNTTVANFEYSATDTSFISNNFVSENIAIDTALSNISLLNTDFRTLSATIDSGNFAISTKYDRLSYQRKIEISEGEIVVNGISIGQKDESANTTTELLPGSLSVTVTAGSIDMTFGSEALPALPSEEEGAEETPAA